MNDTQESKLNMLDVLVAYMTTNLAKYLGMTPIENAVSKVKNGRDAIVVKAGAQDGTSIKGATTDKAAARIDFATAIVPLSDCAVGYALDIDDNDLASKFKTTKSAWEYGIKDGEVETQGQQVIADLTALGGSAVPYGVNPADVAAAGLLLDAYIAASTVPRTRIVEKSVATEELVPLFKETDGYLEKLDRLMGRFRNSDSGFYLGYVGARVIVDSGGSVVTPPTPPTP
ncbi:MAG: hypothetical protein ACKVOR_14340 [Flavobacteriales bacterium]